MAETMERAARVGLTWEEVCADPNLEDLPYKIETNEWGQIVMSPRWLKQGACGAAMGGFLHQSMKQRGSIVMNAAVKTSNRETALEVSALVPGFPKKIEV